jgi:hypothetical protein
MPGYNRGTLFGYRGRALTFSYDFSPGISSGCREAHPKLLIGSQARLALLLGVEARFGYFWTPDLRSAFLGVEESFGHFWEPDLRLALTLDGRARTWHLFLLSVHHHGTSFDCWSVTQVSSARSPDESDGRVPLPCSVSGLWFVSLGPFKYLRFMHSFISLLHLNV